MAEEIDCAVIPIHQTSLLVPNVSIAEITPWRRLRPKPDTPSWHLGTLAWRTLCPLLTGRIRNLYRFDDIVDGRARDVGDRLLGRRIDDRKRRAIRRRAPPAPDKQFCLHLISTRWR